MYEQIFVVEAMRRGLNVHMTFGDYLNYDVLVTNDKSEMFRVQIKGTEKMIRKGYRIDVCQTKNKQKVGLDCGSIEVLACYLADVDVWYLMPCEEIWRPKKRTLRFWPHIENGKGLTEHYREAWEIFG